MISRPELRDVWANQFLFWAIVVGFVTIFPVLYIPVINHVVFKHTGISWEWIIVFVETALFFAGVEQPPALSKEVIASGHDVLDAECAIGTGQRGVVPSLGLILCDQFDQSLLHRLAVGIFGNLTFDPSV